MNNQVVLVKFGPAVISNHCFGSTHSCKVVWEVADIVWNHVPHLAYSRLHSFPSYGLRCLGEKLQFTVLSCFNCPNRKQRAQIPFRSPYTPLDILVILQHTHSYCNALLSTNKEHHSLENLLRKEAINIPLSGCINLRKQTTSLLCKDLWW